MCLTVGYNCMILLLIVLLFAFAVTPITFAQIYLFLVTSIYLFLNLIVFGIIQFTFFKIMTRGCHYLTNYL